MKKSLISCALLSTLALGAFANETVNSGSGKQEVILDLFGHSDDFKSLSIVKRIEREREFLSEADVKIKELNKKIREGKKKYGKSKDANLDLTFTYITADWSGAGKLGEVVLNGTVERIREYYKGASIRLERIDYEKNKEYWKSLGVTGLPTMLIENVDTGKKAKVVGAQTISGILNEIEKISDNEVFYLSHKQDRERIQSLKSDKTKARKNIINLEMISKMLDSHYDVNSQAGDVTNSCIKSLRKTKLRKQSGDILPFICSELERSPQEYWRLNLFLDSVSYLSRGNKVKYDGSRSASIFALQTVYRDRFSDEEMRELTLEFARSVK